MALTPATFEPMVSRKITTTPFRHTPHGLTRCRCQRSHCCPHRRWSHSHHWQHSRRRFCHCRPHRLKGHQGESHQRGEEQAEAQQEHRHRRRQHTNTNTNDTPAANKMIQDCSKCTATGRQTYQQKRADSDNLSEVRAAWASLGTVPHFDHHRLQQTAETRSHSFIWKCRLQKVKRKTARSEERGSEGARERGSETRNSRKPKERVSQ